MEELLARITAKTGVGREPAGRAIAIIVNHLNRHAPAGRMAELFAAIPGSAGLIEPKKKGGLFGRLGGGLLGVWTELKATGMSSTEMRDAGNELLAFAEERLGKEAIAEMAASVPGLKQFL